MLGLNMKTWKLLPSTAPHLINRPSSSTAVATVKMEKPKSPSSKPRKRSSYGTSRKSILKKTFKQEQVTFTAPFSDEPHVAIIGGGISGLICAIFLDKRGIRSTVFDTGIHGLGGRLGTRLIDDSLLFDHAAQFFTVNDSRFSEIVNVWLDKGLVRQWKGTVGELKNGGEFLPFLPSPPRYIATRGMRFLADSLLSEVRLFLIINYLFNIHSLFSTIQYLQLSEKCPWIVNVCQNKDKKSWFWDTYGTSVIDTCWTLGHT